MIFVKNARKMKIKNRFLSFILIKGIKIRKERKLQEIQDKI